MFHDDPLSADEEVARLRLELRNTNLSTLVELGIDTYDHDEDLVGKGPRFDTITPLSGLPDNHGGELPPNYLERAPKPR